MTISSNRQASVLLCVAMLATVALYWPGLRGPFLFDDTWNLLPVQQWVDGTGSWQSVVFGNTSGSLGRSLSMASFLLQAWLGGTDAFAFKFGNLIVHLACGLLAWQVLRCALTQDRKLAAHAPLIATLVPALWLLHPLHVSTVLYAVQRMAQLSTLFALAAVWAYLTARRQLDAGRMPPALLRLFVLFPLLLACGLLSKENAAVAPALCLVLEIAYWGGQKRPRRILAWFFGIFLALPVLAVAGLLAYDPDRLLGGYSFREFTLAERLLTQPRVLLGYIGQLLLPRGPSMGLYTDGLAASKGLFSPLMTFWAILALVAISAFAIRVRNRAPSVFAGWFFFLAAHGVESTFLPLELAFEHRNYLPSVGLLLAVAGLGALVPSDLRTKVMSQRQLALLATGSFAAVLAFATLGRVLVWQHKETIVAQALKSHPDSRRATLDQAALYLEKKQFPESMAVLAQMSRSDDPRWRTIALLNMVTIDCQRGLRGDPTRLTRAAANPRSMVTLPEAHAWQFLATTSIKHACKAAPLPALADTMQQVIAGAASQPDTAKAKWLLRYNAARLYMRAERWQDAETQARMAWEASNEPAIGGLLVSIYAHNKKPENARQVLAAVSGRIKPYDLEGQANLSQLRESSASNTAGTVLAPQ